MVTIEPITRDSTNPNNALSNLRASTKFGQTEQSSDDQCLKLKGQMLFVPDWDAIIFLATPV